MLSMKMRPELGRDLGDRRLLIGNTNLYELESGLARTIAVVLERIGLQAQDRHDELTEERDTLAEREAGRAASVAIAAGRIRFEAHASLYH